MIINQAAELDAQLQLTTAENVQLEAARAEVTHQLAEAQGAIADLAAEKQALEGSLAATKASLQASEARLLEIHELEKRIKATSEELAGAESEGKEAASTAAAVQTALQDELEQARTEMQAASAAGIAKEAALSEEKAALEGRLRKVTAAYHILEDEAFITWAKMETQDINRLRADMVTSMKWAEMAARQLWPQRARASALNSIVQLCASGESLATETKQREESCLEQLERRLESAVPYSERGEIQKLGTSSPQLPTSGSQRVEDFSQHLDLFMREVINRAIV
ncbi:g6518 [Coccomyxa viridis]|uniref:G6518 protein n=1 Tax=Coccomyxa viridis TaxID=1274662 RepID=A0ABP1FXX0_9CHLO